MSTGCFGVKKQKLSNTQTTSNAIACALSCLPHAASQAFWSDTNRQPHAPNCPKYTMNSHKRELDESSGDMNGYNNQAVSLDMVVFCFDVLVHHLKGSDQSPHPKFPNQQFPLFVTWKAGKERKLRGCIGTFNMTALHQGLKEYSITSAVRDSRFDPITQEELPRLHCSVSLLTNFQSAQHYLDWQIGTHGIRIEFNSDKGSKKAATYLPEVAVEQGWNHMQTIDSLLRKGGFKGSISEDIRLNVLVVRFQSEKATVSHAEYIAHKNKHEQGASSNNGYHRNGYHKAAKSSHMPSFPQNAPSSSNSNQHRYDTRSNWPPSPDRSNDANY